MNRREPSIYLDFTATTPVDPEVSAVVHDHMMKTFGNASSVHAFGRTAKVILEESRERIAASIRAEPSEVFFTGGGTAQSISKIRDFRFLLSRSIPTELSTRMRCAKQCGPPQPLSPSCMSIMK